MPRGGKREGSGRKQGSKTSNNTTVFYANCTQTEKELLKFFLDLLRKTPENKNK